MITNGQPTQRYLEKAVNLAVALTPIWVLLGIKILIFQLISVFLFQKVLGYRHKQNKSVFIPLEAWIFVCLIVIYIFSLFINAPDIPPSRLLGSTYNLTIWVMGLVILLLIYNNPVAQSMWMLRGVITLGLISSVVALTGGLLWITGYRELAVFSPISSLLTDVLVKDPALLVTTRIHFLSTEWFFRNFPRSSSFFPYPTAMGIFMVISILTTVRWAQFKHSRGFLWLLVPQLLGLFLTLSRMAMFVLIFSGIKWLVINQIVQKRKRYFQIAIILLVIAVLFPLLVYNWPKIQNTFINNLIKSRSSVVTRFILYERELDIILENWHLGIGYKPRVWRGGTPIGSHSTYLGLPLKIGVLGFIFLVFLVVRTYWIWLSSYPENDTYQERNHWAYLGCAFTSFVFWMFTEDIDATQVVPFIFFVIIARILSLRR